MYAQSATRRASVAAVLVATLAAIVAAGTGSTRPGATVSARPAAARADSAALPQLPEVVVAAFRLPS